MTATLKLDQVSTRFFSHSSLISLFIYVFFYLFIYLEDSGGGWWLHFGCTTQATKLVLRFNIQP